MTSPFETEIKRLGDAHAATLDAEAQLYWRDYAERIARNLTDARALMAQHPVKRVLDIGPSFQTVIFSKLFPDIALETMGWQDDRFRPGPDTVHHTLDLNQTAHPEACPLPAPVDLILFLEVIEHLHTSPSHVLRYLHRCLHPEGMMLITTPNAAWLRHRLQLLIGQNPYALIRESAANPGHFRELTRAELVDYCEQCGFTVVDAKIENLFRFGSPVWRLFARVTDWGPENFRRDMTVLVRKANPPA
jgi:predicted SAM-dependent methyltransferase